MNVFHGTRNGFDLVLSISSSGIHVTVFMYVWCRFYSSFSAHFSTAHFDLIFASVGLIRLPTMV